jgi:hypothetical protein
MASPLPGTGSRTTWAPWAAATAAVSSVEALSITTTSSTSVAASAVVTTAPTVAASFHAGMSAATRGTAGGMGDGAGAVRLEAIQKATLWVRDDLRPLAWSSPSGHETPAGEGVPASPVTAPSCATHDKSRV